MSEQEFLPCPRMQATVAELRQRYLKRKPDKDQFGIKLHLEPYLPLSVEWVEYPGSPKSCMVAHYQEINGDLVPDPLIEFDEDWCPTFFENSLAVLTDKRDIARFAEEWAGILRTRYLDLPNRPPVHVKAKVY